MIYRFDQIRCVIILSPQYIFSKLNAFKVTQELCYVFFYIVYLKNQLFFFITIPNAHFFTGQIKII